ncbi:uncharacterized protein BDR25DRAFT_348981 [Lindgomyces ingoldianus]|uniref:Uncharacterized protein n=1 Tax=Lindgomyces ingoldianus TaxID=673940 RepID=A0ACB6RCP0_9PLEO|nr:uncharacterized protein BDR25DRAFT_348981 [Lindgomyces ingoldianus]KAF2477094.1 hypothetical protein BDR25DRAFT_348981 [Lindgomyces ingoldianus]
MTTTNVVLNKHRKKLGFANELAPYHLGGSFQEDLAILQGRPPPETSRDLLFLARSSLASQYLQPAHPYIRISANQPSLLSYAGNLEEFEEKRRAVIHRPVVFISHTLGGLLVKAVMRESLETNSMSPG